MSKSSHSDEPTLHRVGKPDYETDIPEYVKCVYCIDKSCGLCEYGMLLVEDGKIPCQDCGGGGVLYGLDMTFCTTCHGSGLVKL